MKPALLSGSIYTDLYRKPHELSWIEQYWWVLLIIAISLIAMTFAVLYFVSLCSKNKEVQVDLYSHDYRHCETYKIRKGSTYHPPAPKLRDGYEFRGWFLDSACTVPWISTYKVKRNMALYPKWEKL